MASSLTGECKIAWSRVLSLRGRARYLRLSRDVCYSELVHLRQEAWITDGAHYITFGSKGKGRARGPVNVSLPVFANLWGLTSCGDDRAAELARLGRMQWVQDACFHPTWSNLMGASCYAGKLGRMLLWWAAESGAWQE